MVAATRAIVGDVGLMHAVRRNVESASFPVNRYQVRAAAEVVKLLDDRFHHGSCEERWAVRADEMESRQRERGAMRCGKANRVS